MDKGAIVSIIVFGIIIYLFYVHFLIANPCAFGECTLVYSSNHLILIPAPLNRIIIANGTSYLGNVSIIDGKASKVFLGNLNGYPVLAVWNVPVAISSYSYLLFSVPDTFLVHMDVHAQYPITVYIMTYSQYSQFAVNGKINYVQKYYGENISFWFNESSGCAGYVGVITSSYSQTIYPNESLVYEPANAPTGICA